MKRRLLDFLRCPECLGPLDVATYVEIPAEGLGKHGSVTPCARHGGSRRHAGRTAARRDRPTEIGTPGLCATCYGSEILEGALECPGCPRAYPIIAGVPRLLEARLLAALRPRYEDFFARYPGFLPPHGDATEPHPLATTMESFTRQRLDLRPPGPRFADQWRANLARDLGPRVPLSDLRDRLILDAGCGFGRHLYVAAEEGAEIIGFDLSGGVDLAWEHNRLHPRCHVIQADLFNLPLAPATFDIVWSFGVLHHLPDPTAGFEQLTQLARPDGGLVAIWVYGYKGMSLSYRLSQVRSLRRVTTRLPGALRVQLSMLIAAVMSIAYWEPLRLANRFDRRGVLRRLPLTEQADQDWLARVAAVHNRISTPITHFLDREQLQAWFGGTRWRDAVVEDTDRRGWRAHGRLAGDSAEGSARAEGPS